MRTQTLSWLLRWDLLAALAFVAALAAVPILISSWHADSPRPSRALSMLAQPAALATAPAQPAATAPAPPPAPPRQFIQPHQAVDATLLVAQPLAGFLPNGPARAEPAGFSPQGPLVVRAVADLSELVDVSPRDVRLSELPLASQSSPDVARMGPVASAGRPAADRPPATQDPTRGRWLQAAGPAILSPRRAGDLRLGELRARGIADPPDMVQHASATPAQVPAHPQLPLVQAPSRSISAPIGPPVQKPEALPATVWTDPTEDVSRQAVVSAEAPRRQSQAPALRLGIPDPYENLTNLQLRTVFSDDDPAATAPLLPPRAALEMLPVPPAPPPPPAAPPTAASQPAAPPPAAPKK